MSTPFYFLLSLFLFLFFNFHAANPSPPPPPPPCPTAQLSCGGSTWTIKPPFFTNSTTTSDLQCQKLHLIQCVYQRLLVQFYGTGLLYIVRNISYFDRTIRVDELNLYPSTWNSNCSFLYSFKNPTPISNLSRLTSHVSAALSSFSCSMLENEDYQTIFGNFLGPLSCKDYTLFFSQNPDDQHQSSHLPAYCPHFRDHWFNWKLSFAGGRISVLSGGFSYGWDFPPDCFTCQVSADSSCTTSADHSHDPNPSCGCTKQCHAKGSLMSFIYLMRTLIEYLISFSIAF